MFNFRVLLGKVAIYTNGSIFPVLFFNWLFYPPDDRNEKLAYLVDSIEMNIILEMK